MVDLDSNNAKTSSAAADIKSTQKQSFSKDWERDVIMRIARKLGRLSIDVDLMFGIFSRGTKTCTREDFKYCCLQRLNLKDEISERELDMLLDSKLKDKTNMEQRDFVNIFAQYIAKARNESQNQEAEQRSLMMRYQDKQRESGQTLHHSKTVEGVSLMDF